jgi:hypothetical protein
MSLTFTNIQNKIWRITGTNSTTYTTAEIAIDSNLALDEVYTIGLKARGWNLDDFNHSKDPFITIDTVAGQRDYHFTYDEQSNLILDIHRVMLRESATSAYKTLTPVDMQSGSDVDSLYDGLEATGTPTRYDKTGNGIFLDPVPVNAVTAGLKVFISRQASYFTSSDTTKVAGIDGLCHDYLYLKPAYEYARDKGLSCAERLYRDLQDARKRVEERYGQTGREKDTNKRISVRVENNH